MKVRQVWSFFLLVFFPSALRNPVGVSSNLQPFRSHFRQYGLPVIVAFAGLGDEFNFGRSLESLRINYILIRDLRHNWYLNSIKGLGGNVLQMAETIRAQIVPMQPSKIVFIGASCGGFASILYGHLLKVDKVIAFSPQTFCSRWLCLRYFDSRWHDRISEISRIRNAVEFLDLSTLIKNSNIQVQIFFDWSHRLDSVHARRLSFANVSLQPYLYGGHNLVRVLRDIGELDKILKANI